MIEVWLREMRCLDKFEEKGYWEGACIELRIQLSGGDFIIIDDGGAAQDGQNLECYFRKAGFEYSYNVGDEGQMTFLGYL